MTSDAKLSAADLDNKSNTQIEAAKECSLNSDPLLTSSCSRLSPGAYQGTADDTSY